MMRATHSIASIAQTAHRLVGQERTRWARAQPCTLANTKPSRASYGRDISSRGSAFIVRTTNGLVERFDTRSCARVPRCAAADTVLAHARPFAIASHRQDRRAGQPRSTQLWRHGAPQHGRHKSSGRALQNLCKRVDDWRHCLCDAHEITLEALRGVHMNSFFCSGD
jgi:hypothetical protein